MSNQSGPPRPEAMARFIARFVESVGLERPAVVGNSVGGALGLMTALKYPDLVSGLVLVDSASLGKEISLYVRLVSVPLLGEVLESSKLGGTKFMLRNVFHDPRFACSRMIFMPAGSIGIPCTCWLCECPSCCSDIAP